jgi:AraC-like DNA-binding protein
MYLACFPSIYIKFHQKYDFTTSQFEVIPLNEGQKLIKDIRPYLVQANYYLYSGGPYEGQRIGNTYALHLFVDGNGFMTVNGQQHQVEKGTLIFIRPGQPHSFHIEASPLPSYNLYFELWEDEEEAKSAQVQFILFSQSFQSESWTKQEPCKELDYMPTRFSLRPYPQLMDIFIQIQHVCDQSVYYRMETINSLLYTWMLQWFNAIHAPRATDKRIIQITREIEQHPEKHTRYEAWCDKCGLQKSYFYKLFKNETGLTPKAYLLKVKMKKASALLLESNKSITAIAEELGYPTIHYFSKQFHIYYRTTPSAYRNRNVFMQNY